MTKEEGWASVDCVIGLVSCVSVGASAICWANGPQKNLPKFHSLLLIQQLIKKQAVGPLHRDTHMYKDNIREREDQGAVFIKINVKNKLTR